MSNPIINPLWIYLINVANNLQGLCLALTIFSGAGLFVGCAFYFMWRQDSYSSTYEEDVKTDKVYQRILKRIAIILTISSLLVTLVPSEKVMYTMLVANYVTEENIEITTDALTDMVDYIFEKVDELGE